MSKPNSGHFKGTTGTHIASSLFLNSSNRAIINTSGDDLREHPIKYKQPGSKKLKRLRSKAIQSHHTYSVAKYPHLANKSKYIQPVTPYEHLHGYHGGNYKNSLPGKPIKNIKEF